MADNRATLALKKRGTKSLSFETAQDCLNFANAFYMTKTLQSEQEDKEKQVGASVTMLPVEVSPSVIEPILSSSSLSDEEKQLLKQYRKIRLSKSPDEAMQHVVGNSIPGPPKSILTEEEEKVEATEGESDGNGTKSEKKVKKKKKITVEKVRLMERQMCVL